MKQLFSYLFVGIILIVVQTALLPHVVSRQLRPDLILILVLYMGLKEKSCRGAIYAWILGCLQDVFSGTTLGLYGIIMLIIFCATTTISRQFSNDNNMALVFATICGTIIQTMLLVVILLIFSESNQSLLPIIHQLPLQLIANLFVVAIIASISQPLKQVRKHQKLHHAQQRNRTSWR